jgi:hypothetical protein
MTIKQLCRKRNKLVLLSSKLDGENKNAVELAIFIIDLHLDGDLDYNATNQLNELLKQIK